MESAKPIEPGCLAMFINLREWPEYNYHIVSVVRLITTEDLAEGYSISSVGSWMTDLPHPFSPEFPVTTKEEHLLRIDDPDLQKQIEAEEELVVVR